MPKDIALSEPEFAQEWIFVPKPANVVSMTENLSYRRSRSEMNRSDEVNSRRSRRARATTLCVAGALLPLAIVVIAGGPTELANMHVVLLVIGLGFLCGCFGLALGYATPSSDFHEWSRRDVERLEDDRWLGWGIYTDNSIRIDDT